MAILKGAAAAARETSVLGYVLQIFSADDAAESLSVSEFMDLIAGTSIAVRQDKGALLAFVRNSLVLRKQADAKAQDLEEDDEDSQPDADEALESAFPSSAPLLRQLPLHLLFGKASTGADVIEQLSGCLATNAIMDDGAWYSTDANHVLLQRELRNIEISLGSAIVLADASTCYHGEVERATYYSRAVVEALARLTVLLELMFKRSVQIEGSHAGEFKRDVISHVVYEVLSRPRSLPEVLSTLPLLFGFHTHVAVQGASLREDKMDQAVSETHLKGKPA